MEAGEARTLIEENNCDDRIMLIDKEGEITKLNLTTGLGSSRFIDDEIDESTA